MNALGKKRLVPCIVVNGYDAEDVHVNRRCCDLKSGGIRELGWTWPPRLPRSQERRLGSGSEMGSEVRRSELGAVAVVGPQWSTR